MGKLEPIFIHVSSQLELGIIIPGRNLTLMLPLISTVSRAQSHQWFLSYMIDLTNFFIYIFTVNIEFLNQ